jgi:hypothetical protein
LQIKWDSKKNGDQVKDDEIAEEYGTNGRYQQCAQKFVGEFGKRAAIGIHEILLT